LSVRGKLPLDTFQISVLFNCLKRPVERGDPIYAYTT
jgi:hypothetical protein